MVGTSTVSLTDLKRPSLTGMPRPSPWLTRGVTIAMGTDISISGVELANSWGRNGRELPLLVQAGLTPLEAIQAATANGPLTLGPQAPRSGQLAEGYDADLIVLDGDPVADITMLADPAHVAGVWKAGRRVKGPRSNLTEHH